MNRKRPAAGWSLRNGLLLSFGLATLLLFLFAQALIIFGVPGTTIDGLWRSQVREAIADLSAKADTRKYQLERWVFERRADLRFLAENPLLQEALHALLHHPTPTPSPATVHNPTLERLRLYLQRVEESYAGEYAQVEIIDATSGKILVSTAKGEEGKDLSQARYFREAINPAVEEVVSKELDEKGQAAGLILARAVHDPASATIHAVLVLHANDQNTFFHLTEGLGETGEILLVDQEGRLQTPPHFPLADGGLAQPLLFLDPSKPSLLAARGVETVVKGDDYRGVQVLAATRHLRLTTEMAWGLIVKKDMREVYQPIRRSLATHALILGGALLFGGLLVWLIATRLTTPFAALGRTAAAIADGDLAVRARPGGSRELRELAHSFNSMVTRVEDWHRALAAEVEKRTGELTLANAALLASEEGYRRIVETSGEGIWLGDEEYRSKFVNPRFAEMLGYPPGELLGKDISLFMTAEEQSAHREQVALRRQGLSARYERRMIRQDGSLLWAMISATPIISEEGCFQGSLAMVSDISEQKRMATALQENQARLDLALRSAGMGVFQLELATGQRTFDAQTRHLFGLDDHEEKISAEEFFHTVREEDRETIRAALARTISQEVPYEAEYRVLWPDGSLHHLAARGRLARDDNGQPTRIIGVAWDVTANREAAAEREKLRQQLNQAQKIESIGTLAGGIAHDFNNILGAILGYADLAMEDAPPGTHFQKDLDKILLAAHRAKNLVRQILDFSRQTQVDCVALKLQPLLHEALILLRASLPATIEIQENIAPQEGMVVADPTQIHQIMMNLGTNAYHAMERQGGILRVDLRRRTILRGEEVGCAGLVAGDYLELTVADSGEGIGPEVMARIFDPYFTTKEFGKGTGMGLAITHGIVKSYGGAITVESTVGQGTSFRLYFPVVAGPMREEAKVANFLPRGQERILFVDDEEIIIEFAQEMLSRLGYEPTACRSGAEALALFATDPRQFDLVLTDQTMPGMTGGELARRLLQIRPDLPIILCTGYSNLIDETAAQAMGIKGFAQKPLTREFIALLLRKVLDESGAHRPAPI